MKKLATAKNTQKQELTRESKILANPEVAVKPKRAYVRKTVVTEPEKAPVYTGNIRFHNRTKRNSNMMKTLVKAGFTREQILKGNKIPAVK
jgi:hypothetical protein